MKVSGFFYRFFCLLLICALLAPAALAGAADLSAMTDDEIISLLDEVNAEIVRRGINKTAKLPEGAYIVGRDLPAGRYIFTSLATGDDWGNVTVYSEGGKGRQLLWEIVSAPEAGEDPDTIFVTLSDGDQLKSGVPFSLTIMSGAVFR
ncbi:MAG: hypothetical protein Q4G19_04075 [Clostridia bacterium]|nr:hypothetical protein [Clostridia bacterium]